MTSGNGPAGPGDGEAVDDARRLFEDHGLPFPPVPPELAPRVSLLAPWVYGTREEPPVDDAMTEFAGVAGALYFLDAFVRELEAGGDGGPGDYVLFGHAGHGIESQAIHYYLVLGPLAVFLQLQWGTPDTDSESAALEMAGHYHEVGRLMEVVDEAARRGRLEVPRRVVVCVSDFRLRASWAILDPQGDDVSGDPWRRETVRDVWDVVAEAVASL